MAQKTAAGSKVYISNSPATATDQAAFETLTWHVIGEITQVGDFGTQYQDIATNTIGQRQTKHFKGAFDEGTLDLTVYADPGDQGQTTAQTALHSDSDWGIKITLNDGDTSPTTFYYLGQVMSYRRTISDVNSMVTANIGVALNSAPVEVAAV